ncbi:MAG: hypothetical protein R3E08_02790 [Thiotrichaceae bacterium]
MINSQNLIKELRNNARLRIGLGFIAIILASYIFLLLDEYRQKLQTEHQAQVKRLAQLEGVTRQTEWTQRASDARALMVELQDKLWRANSKGLAQANLQAWLDSQIKAAAITETRLTMESTVDSTKYENLWQVTAQINGNFTASSLDTLLLAFAKNPQWVMVDRLEIYRTKPAKFLLVVTAFFQAHV